MKRGWFGPKIIGWGASPASWEGWAVTGVFIMALVVSGILFQDKPWAWAPMLTLIAAFLAVVARTYDKNARTGI